jgi:copper chaperone CopZ
MRHVTTVAAILVMAGLFAVLVACDQQAGQVHTVFTVTGMHCDACSASIVTALEKVEGVDEITADHEKGVAEAVYRPRKVDVEELKSEIEKLGYTVIGVKTEVVEG